MQSQDIPAAVQREVERFWKHFGFAGTMPLYLYYLEYYDFELAEDPPADGWQLASPEPFRAHLTKDQVYARIDRSVRYLPILTVEEGLPQC